MGSIYGGHLSLEHEVYIIDTNRELVEKINADGLTIEENGTVNKYYPKAVTNAEEMESVELVVLFVKALYSKAALLSNKKLIGEDTYLLTLQNGSGHEDLLSEFVPMNRVIIGTTEDNGNIVSTAHVRRGGSGITNLGMLTNDTGGMLQKCKNAFDASGFHVRIHDNIQWLIWDKLFTNVSLSVVTGILQVPMGFVAGNPDAWLITKRLIKETVNTANALGLDFEYDVVVRQVKQTSQNNPNGYTSIYADLKAGRKTEVDTISGSVIRAAQGAGVSVPAHELIVDMVHAMEERWMWGGWHS